MISLDSQHVHEAVALWEECGLTRPWNDPVADFERAVNGPASTVLGIVDATVIGTVMVGHDGHRGWVYYLAVSPERRGEGLGRALMAAAKGWVRSHGIPKLQLMVRRENAAVVAFYEQLGYSAAEVVVLGKGVHTGETPPVV